ncbi:LysR family transcriptional regulator [Lactobacillus johnsonii]|uniref:LysR family transcriptional regulator n=1 Tax=Lactobacillus johnsonii TaxID=33959 RepID=UPI0028ECF482|nr:LysR family transcriptional regulator [Lactobacillus johnsonii]MDT9605520.1 LysR family transcriptional regulator [Lactobacillus johnsonii]
MYQQMKYYIAVVEAHSFTQAAEICNISQSAISQQIKELENTLNVQLLKRVGRSFELTTAGHYFYQQSKKIVQEIEDTIKKTQEKAHKEIEQYNLRLGYLVNFGTQEFLQAVAQFSQMYPDVKVTISNGMHEDLFQLLKTNKIDLAFSDQRRALSTEYENEFLTETNFQVLLPIQQFKNQDKISSAGLKDMTCILVTSSLQKDLEEKYYRDVLGIQSQFQLAATFDEAQMIVAMGQGYTIINERTKAKVNKDVVHSLPLYLGKNPLKQKYYAFWKKENSGYYIESFANILKEQF